MNYNLLGYGVYGLVILVVILYVGNVLFKSGRPFLVNTFHGDERMADAINRVLISGYYLVNIGYSVIVLKIWELIPDVQRLTEVLGLKIGTILLALGLIHVLNVILLTGIGKNKKHKTIHTNTH